MTQTAERSASTAREQGKQIVRTTRCGRRIFESGSVRGWDLASLREHYEQVERIIGALAPRTPDEKLFESMRLSNEYGALPRTDPQLPEALVPDWIGRRVARRIEALRAWWKPAAEARFAEIDAESSSRTAVAPQS